MPADAPDYSSNASLCERISRLEAVAMAQTRLAEAELDLEQFMQAVIDELEQLVDATGIVLELVEGAEMVYRAVNPALAQFEGMRIKRAGSLSGFCVERREMLICRDTADDPRVDRAACERTGIRSMICAPLLHGAEAVGVVKISSDRPDAFTDDDMRALRLLTAALAAEMGKQLRFRETERVLAERTAATRSLARQVGERLELEAKLRAREQRLAGIIANAHQAIITMTERGIITCWNRQAELTFGWSEQEALGQPMAELIVPPEMRRMHDAGLRGFVETREGRLIGQRIEVVALHRNGTRLPIEMAINAARSSEGWEFTALLHDISERRSKTELFENAFNHAPIGMALVGLDGALLKVNEGFCRIVGYSAAEASTLDFQTITHPDDLQSDLDQLKRLLAREIPSYELVKRYIGKCGGTVWARLSVSLVEGPDGSPKHLIAQVENLTSEREAENRYRLMAQNTTDIIVTSDLAGRITFASPACERILALDSENLLGSGFDDIVHRDDIRSVRRAFLRLRKVGAGERVRWRARHRDGHWVWLESSPALLRDGPEEAVTGFIDVIRDVTARKQGEDALADARAKAELAVRSKSDFVANVSHELRTPLNSIIGFSRLLTNVPGLDAEPQRWVRLIHNAGEALRGVIDNVLDFSKLEAAALELNCAPFDVRAFVGETMALMEPQAAAKDLAVRSVIAPDVPAWVTGDESRLRQVLLNLLSNAVKFTGEGCVTLSVSAIAAGPGETRLRVEVEDTGTGIRPERVESLFNRFVQAAPTVASHYGGTGLGLAITRQLVDLMGGDIGLVSDVGCGSTFWFELTLPVSTESTAVLTGGDALHADILRGKRVLVADDVDLNRDLMLATLSRYGCDVELAVDGSEAVSAVLARPFDLVLMDCQMPVMDGFAATRAIRSSDTSRASIPIVAVTASAQASHLARCKEAGMNDHLTKPLSEIDLERILLRFLCADPSCLAMAAPAAEAAVEAEAEAAVAVAVAAVPLGLDERYRLRKEATLDRIAAMIRSGHFTDLEAAEIVALVHQLAGTAGMFGDAELGEEARALETGLDSWTAEERPDGIRAAYERLRLVA